MAIRKKRFLGNNRVLSTLFNSEIWPYTTTFLFIIIMFITIRMKSVEQIYLLNQLEAKIEKNLMINKEIKAERAQLLSDGYLRKIALSYSLKEPGPEQIILIPE